MGLVHALTDRRTLALFILALSIVLGLMVPGLAEVFSPFAMPALFLVVLFSLVPFAPLDKNELITLDWNVGRVVLWQQLLLPSIVIALGVLCRFPDYVISLLVVTTCSGALFASPALAALLDLDRRQSLQCMVVTTLSMPVSMYCFLTILHGFNFTMDLQVYLFRIFIFLAVPALVFIAYRWIALKLRNEVRFAVENVAQWAVVVSLAVFGIGMMSRVAERIAVNPSQVVFFLGLTTVLCIGMLAITTIVMHRYGFNDALTAAILSGFRNVGLGYALIGEMIGPELAVYVGVGLLPVFTAPIVLRLVAGGRNLKHAIEV